MKHLLGFRWWMLSEQSCTRYRQIYVDRIILDRIRVTEKNSQRTETEKQFVVICVGYVSPCSEGDRHICHWTQFSYRNMGPLNVTKLRRDMHTAIVSPGDGKTLSRMAEVVLPSHNTCSS